MNQLTRLLGMRMGRKPKLPFRANEGIITAADALEFIGLQLLYSSLIVRHECRVAVLDMGLTEVQRAWCDRQPCLLRIVPEASAMRFGNEDGWEKWNKPYLMMYSPFERTLWLDSETIVLNDLTQLFGLMNSEPVVVNTTEEMDVDSWFFSRMPGDVRPPSYAKYPSTSVLGLDMTRDFHLLKNWMWVLENVVKNPKLQSSSRRLDSSAMAWALAKAGMTDVAMDNPAWNWMAQCGVAFVGYDSAEELIQNVGREFPIAHVLNWGWPAPWIGWRESELDIEPHAAIPG